MPKAMQCPGCGETTIPTQGDAGNLNCRECDRVLSLPGADQPTRRRQMDKLDLVDSDGDLTKVGEKVVRSRRDAFRRLLAKHLETYIGEAEHQDGEAYWLQFPTASEALTDFIVYMRVLSKENLLNVEDGK